MTACNNAFHGHSISVSPCQLNNGSGTINHPANSWISGIARNDSRHSYKVSLHCPFDYCLPYSTHLNVLDADQQCQFQRTGLLCGYCQRNLSSVFGSSQCKHCTKI